MNLLVARAELAEQQRDELREQRDELLKAVMLAVLNIDCERNGLTPDGNVRDRLVAVIAKVEKR